MLQYLIAGLVVGAVYAISSTALTVTYRSSGILNFGFGGMAFFVARLYYYLNTEHKWPIWLAAVTALLLVSPAMGYLLYYVLFRFISRSSPLVRIIATIGLGVTLGPLALLIFGNPPIPYAPGLAPEPVASYKVFGTAVTLDQIIVMLALVAILLVGYAVVRFTQAGLLVRAMVDSPALTALAGSDPERSSLGVWIVTTVIAGLVGILLAPIYGLDTTEYGLLMAAAFTAVLIGKLTKIGTVIVVSMILGIVSSVAEYLLPPTSAVTNGVIAGMPFIFILLFLLWEARKGEVVEETSLAGHLDRAIASSAESRGSSNRSVLTLRLHYPLRQGTFANARVVGAVAAVAIIALVPLALPGFWINQMAEGLCFALVFLAFTLVTGEGGMIWLCQAAFAGLGAVFTAHLATIDHVPILLALLSSAIVVGLMGLVVGALTTRLGDLYVALATLALGVLADNIVLSLPVFTGQFDNGVNVAPPRFMVGSNGLFYSLLIVFIIVALLVEQYRRSTAGMATSAVRWSARGARSMGITVVQTKVVISSVAAFIAALGGGFLAIYLGQATPSTFNTTTGLVWLAILVTVGVRSNVAALVAGLSYAIMPAVFSSYLPVAWSQVPPALFGLGAILVARNPDGVVAMHARQLDFVLSSLRHRGRNQNQAPGGVRTTPVDVEPVAVKGDRGR